MNLPAARAALARVNRLFDDLSAEGDSPAFPLERDLLREYVRQLYEALGPGPLDPPAAPAPRAREEPAAAPAPAPPPPREPTPHPAPPEAPRPAFAFEPRPAAAARRDVEPAPAPTPPPAAPAPRVIEVPDSVEADVRAIESDRSSRPPAAPRSAGSPPADVASAPESPFAPAPERLPAALRELFAVDAGAADLSARLSASPVPDLGRAFGIGERMLIQKELFGGDAAAFAAALDHLNGLPDYPAAVAYLGGGAAKEYEWADGERAEVAREFARVVRRRYA